LLSTRVRTSSQKLSVIVWVPAAAAPNTSGHLSY
jgi:hypothetical protein